VTKSVYEALGRSLVYEEQKGNFNAAREFTAAKLSLARLQDYPDALADALLAHGLVLLLQGKTAAAADCFQETQQVVPGDVDRCLRAVGYGILAAHEQFNEFFAGATSRPERSRIPSTRPCIRGRRIPRLGSMHGLLAGSWRTCGRGVRPWKPSAAPRAVHPDPLDLRSLRAQMLKL
jgi:hypothetical protein